MQMARETDRLVGALAAGQLGLATPEQLGACGMSQRTICRRVADAGWERWSSRVIAMPDWPESLERNLVAARLHQPNAIGSHSAAAHIRGFPLLPHVEPEVTVTYQDSAWSPFARLHRSADLFGEDIEQVGVLWITSTGRTAADLFTWCHEARARKIVKDLVLSGRMAVDELAASHDRYAGCGRPTTVVVRQLIAELSGRHDMKRSALEAAYLELVGGTELSDPEEQVPVPGWLSQPSRADFAYPAARVVVEVDGRRWHGDAEQFETDRRRDNAAQLAGWIVLRFTWEQVQHRPGYVLETVRAAVRRAAAHDAA
jgi:hypothetical protein